MTVSVCIPVYNGMPWARDALESVLAQTHADLEVVVVDNASTDGTGAYLARIRDPRVRVLTNPATVPPADNWNRALDACTGDYVKLVCADDILDPGCVAESYAALEAEPSAVMAACQRRVIDWSGRVLIRRRGLAGLPAGRVAGEVALRACVRHGMNLIGEPAAVLMRRSALSAAGGFDGEWSYFIDVDLWTRLLSVGDLVVLDRPLAAFRVHDASWSAALVSRQASEGVALVARVRRDQLPSLSAGDVRTGAARARIAALGRRAAYAYWNRRHPSAPADPAAAAAASRPTSDSQAG